tara:strand:+ start:165 stop:1232 length:1068 start_codon:yes stop_codon:yes gene_type:complete
VLLAQMTSPEQSLVVGKMHPRDRREDADRLALLAGTTREEVESRRRGRLVHSAERKTRDFTVGSRGGVRIPIRRVKGGYKWGSKGKVYRNRKDAERQAAAAYASGYKKSMSWFNVLKLGGEDLGGDKYQNVGNENRLYDYDDSEPSGRITDYFYNLKNTATTRPHFEYQAKNPKLAGMKVNGNLAEIVDKIGALGSGVYYSFADADDDTYCVTYRKKKIKDTYEKTKTGLTPERLDNESSVIAFDSVYPTSNIVEHPMNPTFKPLWDNDKKRIQAFRMTPERRQELIQEQMELGKEIQKLVEQRDKQFRGRRKVKRKKDMNRISMAIRKLDKKITIRENRIKHIKSLLGRGRGRI